MASEWARARDVLSGEDAVKAAGILASRQIHAHVYVKQTRKMPMLQHKFTILVAEDEPTDQVFIQIALKSFGPTTTVQVVSNGEEAIAYMMGEGKYADRAQYPYPRFIMTDLKMPKLDGFAVLEHLQANPAWAIIPSVVLTASADPDDIKKAYMLGASAYHIKPQNLNELRTRLKLLHDYWMTCEVPEVDASGKQYPTESKGKLGERFPERSSPEQTRVHH